jgi:hypothetical protein
LARYLILLLLLLASAAHADLSEPVRLDLRLMGADLVDDMVYTWLQSAPLSGPANLIVAEIDAPIGIDQRFEQDIENHLYEVLRANPKLPLTLVHCSLCRQYTAVSNPKRTVIGRSISTPEGQEQLAKYPHLNALALHFDVVGDDLVLWSEIYEVKPPQRVVWSQRYSHRTSARTVLQEPTKLVSISEARAEQERLIQGRDTIEAVTRFPVRTFAGKQASGGGGVAGEVPPLIFLEQSIEATLSPRKNRRAGLSIGVTSIKDSLQGWSFGASFQQLLFRNEPSLTDPDLYLRVAANFIRLEGPGSAVFSQNQIDVAKLINSSDDFRSSLTTYQIGLEAHVKYRFGFSAFVEYIPVLDSSNVIATRSLIIPYHSVGVAGVFLW